VPDGVPYGLTIMHRVMCAVIMSTNRATSMEGFPNSWAIIDGSFVIASKISTMWRKIDRSSNRPTSIPRKKPKTAPPIAGEAFRLRPLEEPLQVPFVG